MTYDRYYADYWDCVGNKIDKFPAPTKHISSGRNKLKKKKGNACIFYR